MELQEFISSSLSEILMGVSEAIKNTKENSGKINPSSGKSDQFNQLVKFDIAVTVSGKSGTEGGGGIKVVGLNLGGQMSEQQENRSVSRIQFAIPITPPTSE